MKLKLIPSVLALSSVSFFVIPAFAATSTYSYDALNRVTNAAYSDGSSESYSYDPAGNRISRVTLAATSPLDTTPPSIPANLVSNSFTPSQLRITWNQSSDSGGSGLAGYYIYVNGSSVATTISTNFTLSGLSPNSQYCLSVAAFDHDNNISPQSISLCLTTPIFQPPLLKSPAFLPNGHFQFAVSGGTVGPYGVFVSTNLITWQLWSNLFLPISGNIVDDPTANGFRVRFYQFRWITNTH